MKPSPDSYNDTALQPFSLFYDQSFLNHSVVPRSGFNRQLKELVSQALEYLDSDFDRLQTSPARIGNPSSRSKSDILRKLPEMIFKQASKSEKSFSVKQLYRTFPNYAGKISEIGDLFSSNIPQEGDLSGAIALIEAVAFHTPFIRPLTPHTMCASGK